MALFTAATLTLEAALEAASLVWMELGMFGLAGLCYVFFVGVPGFGGAPPSPRGRKVVDGKVKEEPFLKGKSNFLPPWQGLSKAKATAGLTSVGLSKMLQNERRSGKSPKTLLEELRSALKENPSLGPVIAGLPTILLREDSLDLAESVLDLAEEEENVKVETSAYAALMASLLKRRSFARVASVASKVPEEDLTPRMLSILASAAAQQGSLSEALQHLRRIPEPTKKEKSEGAGFQLAMAVAMQVLDLATKEKCLEHEEDGETGAVEELLRLQCTFEEKHLEQLLASQLKRSGPEGCRPLLEVASKSLGFSEEDGASVLARLQNGRGGGPSSGGTEVQRCAAAIKAFAKDRNLASASKAFEKLRGSQGNHLTPLIYNCFLDACVQCGDLDRARAHFEEMKELKVLDTVGYNTLLKGFLSRGQTKEARDLVKEMNSQGLSANKVTYNELLHAAVMAKDRRSMWSIVEEMQAAGVQPNAVTCSIILKSLMGYTQVADLRRVSGLIENLEDSIDEVLFSSVVEACIRIEHLDVLTELMQRFRQKGSCVKLSAPTYGSMIKAYGQAGDAERVMELWAEMQEQGVKPTSITLGCLTEALVVNNKAEEAWELVREQMDREELRGSINTVIYSTVLKGFAVVKNLDKVFAVYDEMRTHKIACNTITYNTMLDACAKACAMSRASHLLEDMAKTCVEPDIITYSTIIKGYCLEGDVDRAFHVLEEMKKDGKFRPDEIMYNSILDGCAKQHRVEDSLKVLEEMKTSRISPSNYTLSILVKVLGHARRLGQAFELVESLSKQNNFRPNVQVYTCLVQACIHNRKLERAMSLHDTMVADVGCSVDDKFYAVLVRGCLQLRQPSKAVDVVRAAFQLPGCTLAHSARRDGRHVGLEMKTLEELASKLQGGSYEEQAAWEALATQLQQERKIQVATTTTRPSWSSHHGPAARSQRNSRHRDA